MDSVENQNRQISEGQQRPCLLVVVDLQVFLSTDKKILWFKTRWKEESDVFKCVKRMYNGTKFTV
jgi:hypothetical protein